MKSLKNRLISIMRTFYRVLIVFVPLILVILPADFFDHGPTICISKLLTAADCPGCGITRATQHAIHFDFSNAWNYNKLFVVITPLLIWMYITEVFESYKFYKRWKHQSKFEC